MDRIHAIISGRVQGVWFRKYTRIKALELELKGWVKNLSTGEVELIAEGKENSLLKLSDWLNHGSPNSKVKDLKVEWLNSTSEFLTFKCI
ncbi:MAG: acylphosphatase [Candidatus Marinimicrobia bacterium]|jgi:acylphosphatase|nr:acylphosphatase [Candidatus Neomarinimicrobiota bacterium]MBT3502299.1 acylphosphatase [Candidatus Neomarinimicrobiota bacterium]MBT3840419.1 acylphosphatase [Candidatus Neomarinimicrobiota bacterium]MBT3999484.1 acylphosphatase [Candidatus Neomarinimicrobiota bacterium]MBT4282077.1 acylphosphatase [Candidatus Neomarinimicrobiota bacterium]